MKNRFVLAFVLMTCGFAYGADVAGEEVTYASDDEQVHARLFIPEAKKPLPTIVVIHEWWGLNDWVKEQAQKFAAQGYVTLAVDLYRGKVTTDPSVAHELVNGVPDDRALRDLRAAVAFLKTQKQVDGRRIGAVGWCWGGDMAQALAENEPAIAAVAINYGAPSTEPAEIKAISPHVLGNYGALDQGIPPQAVKEFEGKLKSAGKDVDIKIYPDAGHAFENPNNKKGYRPADAADAWQRMTAFFARTLKSAKNK
jgi:carboxymethylenebutenolidase